MNEGPDAAVVTGVVPVGGAAAGTGRVRVKAGRATLAVLEEAEARGLEAAGVLRVGAVVDEVLLERLGQAEAMGAARREGMRIAARRAMTRKQLSDRLGRKHGRAEVAAAVAHAEGLGLVDDGAYAARFAEGETTRGKAGPRLVEAKLRQRGVEGKLARSATGEAMEGVDQRARARALAEERAARGSIRGLELEAARRRVYGFLARRGFEADVCRDAVLHALPGASRRG